MSRNYFLNKNSLSVLSVKCIPPLFVMKLLLVEEEFHEPWSLFEEVDEEEKGKTVILKGKLIESIIVRWIAMQAILYSDN